MSRVITTARFATILAVAAALFSAGLVSGAAGDPLILGSLLNNSGASGTKVTSSVNGNAFAVSQNGVGASANGLRGDANTGTGGVFTSSSNNALFATAASGNRFAMAAVSNGGAGTGGALFADGNANPAIVAQSDSDDAIIGEALGCTGFLCGRSGVYGYGVGLSGGVTGDGPLGVVGFDSLGGDGFGLYTPDDALVGGDLEVLGTCTGCTAATLGVNGSEAALAQGDAVTATGVTTDDEGNILVTVERAKKGDTVFGVVSAAVVPAKSGTAEAPRSIYKDSGTSVAPGGSLRIITGGIVTFAAADASGGAIAVGDALAASSDGKLAKAADAAAEVTFGTALGTLENGRVVVYID